MARSRRKNPQARPPLPPPTPEPGIGISRRPRPFLLLAPGLLILGLLGGFLIRALVDGDGDAERPSAGAPVFTADGGLRQDVHEHEDFAVYVRGERLDFSRPEFVSTEDKHLSENVDIHAPRTNVVHIHREQTTWDEFLTSLGMGISDMCLALRGGEKLCSGGSETLKFFVNGVRIDSLRFENLTDLGRVLISFGAEDDAALQQQLRSISDEACIPGEQCSARIDPNNPEQEPCSKSGKSCVD